MNYKISVIIPVYNAEQYLEECIESLKKQTIGFENLQVILVDDGSTDNSRKIIEDFSKINSNIISIYLEKSHSIGGFARNKGIEKATGEYLMFLDSDDCYTLNACELMYNMATEKGADIVTANYRCMWWNGELWNKPMFDKDKYKSQELKGASEEYFYLYCQSACLKLFDTKLIKENNIEFLSGIPAEDAYFTTKALLNSKKIWYLSEEIYYYRRRNSGNMSTSWMRNKKYFLGVNEAFREIYELFKQFNKLDYYKYYYAKNFISFIYKFIDSKLITSEDKIELIDKMYWFFEQIRIFDIKISQKSIMILVDCILNKDYINVINVCEIMAEARTYMTASEKDMMSKPERIVVEV